MGPFGRKSWVHVGVPTLMLCGIAVGPSVDARAAAEDPAADYPTRPIRFVAPTSPGGANDLLPRILGARMTENWGQQVVVDLRPGAGGIVGTNIAARATPDGYTLLIVANGYALNPFLHAKLPYDTLKDLDRVALFATAPLVLVVPQQSTARTVQELVAMARAAPGKLNYATAGPGSGGWLSMELLKKLGKVTMTHIPYKGAGQATAAVLGGEVDLLFTSPLAAATHIKSGRVRPLAVTSAKRVPTMKDLPAMSELIPGYEVLNFFGILVPAGTPKSIIAKLNAEVRRIIALPDVKARFDSLGFEPVHGAPEAFTAFVKAEMKKWSTIIREAGIRSDR